MTHSEDGNVTTYLKERRCTLDAKKDRSTQAIVTCRKEAGSRESANGTYNHIYAVKNVQM